MERAAPGSLGGGSSTTVILLPPWPCCLGAVCSNTELGGATLLKNSHSCFLNRGPIIIWPNICFASNQPLQVEWQPWPYKGLCVPGIELVHLSLSWPAGGHPICRHSPRVTLETAMVTSGF